MTSKIEVQIIVDIQQSAMLTTSVSELINHFAGAHGGKSSPGQSVDHKAIFSGDSDALGDSVCLPLDSSNHAKGKK